MHNHYVSINNIICKIQLLLDLCSLILLRLEYFIGGTGIRGLMRGMSTLPQGNQKLLVVRDKVGRPPTELGVSKSVEYDIFSIQCFDTVGWATGRASGL